MNEKDKRATIERYNKRLDIYGHDPRTLGWFKDRQSTRFEVLTQIGKLKDCSILDLGCGFGDLYTFLKERRIDMDYTGYDINHRLIEIAKKAHSAVNFEVKDIQKDKIDRTFDWVISSGVFNYKISNNKRFIGNMLKKMFELCDKGVACDFLSTYVDFENSDAYHSSPEATFNCCKMLSQRVSLRHDYMPYEFCIYIYKDGL